MAIVLTIIGAVAGAALTLGNAKHEASKVEITQKRLDAIEDAIKRHSFAAGFIPCPADPTALPGAAEYGVSLDCGAAAPAGIEVTGTDTDTVWIGAIPTRSLNLPDSDMYDGWQNRFTYAAVTDLAFNPSNFSDYTTNSITGVIRILDANGTQLTDSSPDEVVAYAIVSHGKNARGAITRTGVMPIVCGALTKDDENCDADAEFVDSRISDSTAAANYYDDLIRWKTRNFLEPLDGSSALNNATCSSVSVSVGADINCAINNDDGKIYCWGGNQEGQFGDGVGGVSQNPTPVPAFGGGGGFKAVDVGVSNGKGFTCAINAASELWCAGYNNYGQLGVGYTSAFELTPLQEATGASNWKLLELHQFNACAVNTSGELYCWGQNANGEVGNGATTEVHSPVRIGTDSDWFALGMNNYATCGIRGSGIMYCWGADATGTLGTGGGGNSTVPALVSGGFTDWTLVKGANAHFCALRASGQAYCWGTGGNGRVKGNVAGSSDVPWEIAGHYTDWTHVAAGFIASCGIRSGRLYCWGGRAGYNIPDGRPPTDPDLMPPAEMAGGYTDWVMVKNANRGGCGARSNGKIYCWGQNNAGQVGDGTTNATTTPSPVAGLSACK